LYGLEMLLFVAYVAIVEIDVILFVMDDGFVHLVVIDYKLMRNYIFDVLS